MHLDMIFAEWIPCTIYNALNVVPSKPKTIQLDGVCRGAKDCNNAD